MASGYSDSQAVPPKQLDPGDDQAGTPDHHIERLECLLLAGWESGDPFDQELDIALDAPEIDPLWIRSSIEGMVVVWHGRLMPHHG
jgi:hypothetical protein